MNSPRPHGPTGSFLAPGDSQIAPKASSRFAYHTWREAEIIRLELMISRCFASRTALLRLHRTAHLDALLLANKHQLLRLGGALATLTRIPFTLREVLNDAANAAHVELGPVAESPAGSFRGARVFPVSA
jgi:hypothetical protein